MAVDTGKCGEVQWHHQRGCCLRVPASLQKDVTSVWQKAYISTFGRVLVKHREFSTSSRSYQRCCRGKGQRKVLWRIMVMMLQ